MKIFPLDKTEVRENFAWFTAIQTRWNDNDQYGHVNNVVYYNFFELAIMKYLTHDQALNLSTGPVQAFTAENGCRYHRPIAFPDIIDCGLRVVTIGNSSVRYELGIFLQGDEKAAATGFFIDVFVDHKTAIPVSIPADARAAIERLIVN